jgi:hypothetical protein
MAGRLKPDTVSQYRYYLETLDFNDLNLTKRDVNEKLKIFDGKCEGLLPDGGPAA